MSVLARVSRQALRLPFLSASGFIHAQHSQTVGLQQRIKNIAAQRGYVDNPVAQSISPISQKDWLDKFQKFGGGLQGIGALIAACVAWWGAEWWKSNKEKERVDEKRVKAAEQLGLVGVQFVNKKPHEDIAEAIRTTSKTLDIVTQTGQHMLWYLEGADKNEVRNVIEHLLEKNKKIRILIYPPNPKMVRKAKDREHIKDTLQQIKMLKDQYSTDLFEIKYLTVIPHFHGQLIDGIEGKAHIDPIRLGGPEDSLPQQTIQSSTSATTGIARRTETYGPGMKIKDINADFETLWKKAEKIPDQDFEEPPHIQSSS